MSGFEELLISAGYERDDRTFGSMDLASRPSVAEIDEFSERLADRLEIDPEAMIIEFVPYEGAQRPARVKVVVWWDGDLSHAERRDLAEAFSNHFPDVNREEPQL